jgi:hypothetical protein
VGVLHPPTSHPGSGLSRRGVLIGGSRGLLALAVLGSAAAAGCGFGEPPEPDPLQAPLAAARRDSALAAAAATAAPPTLVPALTQLAADRARHAAALVEELSRAAGVPTPTESPAPAETAAPAPAPTVRDVAAALRESAEGAARLVPTLSGYRAGLLASIAAACTTAHTVGLTPPRRFPR